MAARMVFRPTATQSSDAMPPGNFHLGINLGHDRAAALVSEGRLLVAIEQERLDRVKHSPGLHRTSGGLELELPWEAIDYCLDAVGASGRDLVSVTANTPGLDLGPQLAAQGFPDVPVHSIPSHHLAHAYSAWWPSGLDDSIVLVVDATGSSDESGRTESYSLYRGTGQRLVPLHSEKVESHLAGMTTLGGLYEEITRRIGFVTRFGDGLSHAEAGKTMGLAPYGGAARNLRPWIESCEGSYSIDIAAYDILLEVEALLKRDGREGGRAWMRPELVEIAAKVQYELEEALLHIVGEAIRETGCRNLCLAGGVALNSVANHRLVRELGIRDFFAFPAAGDSGIAAGCAFWADHQHGKGSASRKPLTTAALGKSASDAEILGALESVADEVSFERLSSEAIIDKAAAALSRGEIVACSREGSEYGPRALGQRSILADPMFERMRNVLNARVKHRESYRPFAPVVPVEAAEEVFELGVESPHMLLVAPVRPELRKVLPAITHHDGTGRVQTVSCQDQPFFHSLCMRLKAVRGGPPVILNTSFNLAGEPIVETPEDALRTFLATDIDHLILDGMWVTKSRVEVKEYEDHSRDLPEETLPAGLAADAPSLEVEMAELDAALFHGKKQSAWTKSELRDISARIGRYKEKSRTFRDSELGVPLRSVLGDGRLLLLDPLNGSELIQRGTGKVEHLDMGAVGRLLGRSDRTEPRRANNERMEGETAMIDGTPGTFSAYADADYTAPSGARELCRRLREAGYVEDKVCERLGKNPQQLEPTDLPYLDRFALGSGDLEDLLRLFQLRAKIGEDRARSLLGAEGYEFLLDQGALSSEGGLVSARVDLFPVGELVVATDHRYQILESDKLSEDPVMYLGLDSVGLVNSAPRVDVERHLDLCTGSGVQALVAASYSDYVVGVDLNPRAIRFARFNADLNDICHVDFRLGNLYEPVADEQFGSITANPPFVPSPDESLGFRDGGKNGEAILSRIVQGACEKLCTNGQLSIVTDLVDPDQYIEKISDWWGEEAICGLILTTADRDEVLFSVPHARAPFGQSYEEYSEELSRWVNSYRSASLGTVNFGYILLQENSEAGVGNHIVQRVVSSPLEPVYEQARELIDLLVFDSEDNLDLFEFSAAPGLRVQVERRLDGSILNNEVLVPDNPWFTRYRLEANLLGLLEEAAASALSWANLGERGLQQQARALVEKGLLVGRLCQEAPRVGCKLPRPDIRSSRRIVIDELATKTTPTCVSNYLQ